MAGMSLAPEGAGRADMALVNMKEMLCEARRSKKAVGAFNITNYETAAAVLKAAEAENEPVIIQLYMRLFDTGKAYDLAGTLRRLAFRAKVPVALHLDHGSTVKQATDALAWGYTSVMYDGSRSPYDENVKWTKFVADYAHALGATCEGEIGHVAQGDETALTDVDEAVSFAKDTGVDALAVSIGTAHGYYKAEPKLDIPRCKAIADALPDTPLVLHGGSGTRDRVPRHVYQIDAQGIPGPERRVRPAGQTRRPDHRRLRRARAVPHQVLRRQVAS